MYTTFSTLLTLAATGLVAAVPLSTTSGTPTNVLAARADSAASQIAAVMPSATACPSGLSDCRTAQQAAPYLIQAMNQYGLHNPIEIAGVLALIGYESLNMQYKINQVPEHAASGQGTSNMQQGSFNIEYANSIPELKAKNPTPSTVLSLVTPDEYNFGTGPWYYSTKCASAKSALSQGADAWWTAYMSCVGVSPDQDGRSAYWTRAKTAFGL